MVVYCNSGMTSHGHDGNIHAMFIYQWKTTQYTVHFLYYWMVLKRSSETS